MWHLTGIVKKKLKQLPLQMRLLFPCRFTIFFKIATDTLRRILFKMSQKRTTTPDRMKKIFPLSISIAQQHLPCVC